MKKWQAKVWMGSEIELFPLEAEDEDSAREKAREYFGHDDFDLERIEEQ